jgi:hypothetical protein
MRMPFGKFRGERLEDLPYSYLEWLHELDDLHEPLRSHLNRVWRERFDEEESEAPPRQTPPPDFPDEERALVRELLEAGYRTLALKYHPDCGGSTQAMQRLNTLMNKLRNRGVLIA